MINPRKISLNYSRHKKDSHLSVISNQEECASAKSKKKIEFTVYQDRKKYTQMSADKI